MNALVASIPNILSGTRVALVPVLWYLALAGDVFAVGLGLVAAGVTDVLDGWLARRLGVVTGKGAALDSLGDNLLALSGLVWLVLLRPEVAAAFAVPLAVWLSAYLVFLGIGIVRFRRFGNLHLYSSKAAAALAYVFITGSFLLDAAPVALGWIVFAMALAAVLEGLCCHLVTDDLDEHVGSLRGALRRRRRSRIRNTADVRLGRTA